MIQSSSSKTVDGKPSSRQEIQPSTQLGCLVFQYILTEIKALFDKAYDSFDKTLDSKPSAADRKEKAAQSQIALIFRRLDLGQKKIRHFAGANFSPWLPFPFVTGHSKSS